MAEDKLIGSSGPPSSPYMHVFRLHAMLLVMLLHFTIESIYSNIDMSYGDFIRFLHLFHVSFTFSCNVRDLIFVLSRH